jgi:lipopolysaccharide transport system ATP-binding protein
LLEVGTGFHPELTGRENIFLNGTILGMKRAEVRRKFDEIVAFAEVEKFLDTPVKRYSSGMYMRLAFSVAAHLEPEILIVDEVLAVGDIQFQNKCLNKMQTVSQSGRTVIFVSHNMMAVSQLCQRAYWIEKGALKTTGPANEVVRQYSASSVRVARGDMADAVAQSDGSVVPIGYHVSNDERAESSLLVTHDDILIRIRLDVRRPVQHPAYGIEIQNAQGVRMLSLNTVELGIQQRPPLSGRGGIRDLSQASAVHPWDLSSELLGYESPRAFLLANTRRRYLI